MSQWQHNTLGPFRMEHAIGLGGMGEVWRGVHVEQQVPVAIKILSQAAPRRSASLNTIQGEVRAMAGLHHAGIAMIFDHGELPSSLNTVRSGRLKARLPYIVMEYASLGTLEALEGVALPWTMCQSVAYALLDALAHAHARGVIHRDIKPGNVLLAGDGDLRPGLKLTDFGIARTLRDEPIDMHEAASVGTPHYMAPEQFEARLNDQGPWTDLYALGIMLWELATGRFPFEGDTVVQMAYQHLMTPLPALEGPLPLPEGLEPWLRRMLAKDPRDRFQRAADAAHALQALPGAHPGAQRELTQALAKTLKAIDRGHSPHEVSATLTADDGPFNQGPPKAPPTTLGLLFDHPTSEENDAAREAHHAPAGVEEMSPRDRPPVPHTWRGAQETQSRVLQGVGIGVYGLRRVPLVGRASAQDALWAQLRDAVQHSRPSVTIIHGPAGIGKSSLALWLCERAHELGAAEVLNARHSPISGPGMGLSNMLARHMRCTSRAFDDVYERCEEVLSDLGEPQRGMAGALAEIIAPEPADEGGPPRFETPAERYAWVRRYLALLAARRPVILWLDDVQWGSDAIGLAGHLLKSRDQRDLPLLLLLTARDEALAEAPIARWSLRELRALPGVSQIPLAPLETAQALTLTQRLLGLEPGLATRVAQRCSGNPLFVAQLIGDWVQRGALEAGPEGFRLRHGEGAPLPDDLHAVWCERVDRLLVGLPGDARRALELAAALGIEVNDEEWRAVCRQARTSAPDAARERLLSMRLALEEEGGWRFAHGMLRESLMRTAQEQRRADEHHRFCALALHALHSRPRPDIHERLGHHLWAAGDHDAAADALLIAVNAHIERHAIGPAWKALNALDTLLSHAQAPPEDPRLGLSAVLRARLHGYRTELDEALSLNQRALTQAQRYGWPQIEARALRGLADIERMRGELPRAAAHYAQALTFFEAAGDLPRLAACLLGLGATASQRGELELATQALERALTLWRHLGHKRGEANTLTQLGHIAQNRGDLTGWEALCHQALELYKGHGDQFQLIVAHNELGEIARSRGELKEAEAHYRKAAALCAAMGHSNDVIQLNLGLVLLGRARYQEAREQLAMAHDQMTRSGRQGFRVFAHAALLACATDDDQTTMWDRHIEQIEALLAVSGIMDPDLAWCIKLAAERAQERGWEARAAHAHAIARDLR